MEFWDIYDKDKKPTGRTMKRNDWCLKDGEYHLTVLGVVARPDGTFLITKRVMTKAWAPGCWEVSGGAAQAGEESREAVLREVKEETGYTLTSYQYRGIVTFVSGGGVTEYMSLFTADGFEGEPISCDEGELEWVKKEDVLKLNIWEGDRIFLRLLADEEPFFSLKLVYDGHDTLVLAVLNGEPMELFDILNPDGSKTGIVRERVVAHREGSLHATVHMWIVRPNEKSGYDVLLQKRSQTKDSNPGSYDISSAGHVDAGDEILESAIRELKEELGIEAKPEELHYIGVHYGAFEAEFYGKMFRDRELSSVYVYTEPVEIENLKLQKEEVEAVRWMDYEECRQKVHDGTMPNCIYEDEFRMVREYLEKHM